jgi:hypothetical protein
MDIYQAIPNFFKKKRSFEGWKLKKEQDGEEHGSSTFNCSEHRKLAKKKYFTKNIIFS